MEGGFTFAPSAGPSQAQGAINPTATMGGDMYLRSGKAGTMVEKLTPWLVIGVAIWLMRRK